jgi:hypothetical protein
MNRTKDQSNATDCLTTKFDSDGLPIAVNHSGWNIQQLSNNGWRVLNCQPIACKNEARSLVDKYRHASPDKEYRVYEALDAA